MVDIKETDWKLFKKIKDAAIEKFCTNAFKCYRQIIEDESVHIHSRYLSHYRMVAETDKEMAKIFDGHSRSRALLQLLVIRAQGLADQSLVSKLSQECQEATNPKLLVREVANKPVNIPCG